MSVIDKVNKFVDSNIIKSSFNDIVSDRFLDIQNILFKKEPYQM